MMTKIRVLSVFLGAALCSNALAVTGSTLITAANGGGGGLFGYAQGAFGSAATPTLSDGKVVSAIYNTVTGGPSQVVLRISGFAADPGKAYFNNIALSFCATAPTVRNFSSASSGYSYAAGIGTWSWSTPTQCMKSSYSFTYSLNLS